MRSTTLGSVDELITGICRETEEEADLVRNLAAGCKQATKLQLELDDLKATAAKASKPAK